MRSILGTTRKADITLRADGRIDLSALVTRRLDIADGDVIDILEGNNECYLYIRHRAPTIGKHEATCHPTHPHSHHFRAWSKRLCDALFRICGVKSITLRLATGQAVTLANALQALTIITRQPL